MATTESPAMQAKLTKSNPLSRKLNKTLDISLEDPQTQEALAALSEYYTENTLAARRSLRGDIERRVMANNTRFLSAFAVVANRVQTMEKEMEQMSFCCQDMEDKLRQATNETSHLIKQTQELKDQSQRCHVRKAIIDVFLARFTLPDAEIAILTSPSHVVGVEFFDALKRLERISDDCKALLVTEHQEAGFEIMEKMSSYQETAFEKLFRWAQNECRSLNSDAPEVTASLKNAMRALKERPVLFQTCIDEVSNIRCSAMVRSFLDALTRGGPGGFPRPIEMHAGDPLRYVGDMLAWLHQAATEEREILEAIFDVKAIARRKSQSRTDSVEESPLDALGGLHVADREALRQVLDRNMEGTCRPLKVRIEQLLASQEDPITVYRIANLVQFYEGTLIGVLSEQSQLCLTIAEIRESGYKTFYDTLNAHVSELLRSVQTPGMDLLPPPGIRETVLQLREIMAIYDESLVLSDRREEDFAKILAALLDPLTQMCVLGAASLPTIENAVYIVNCLLHTQSALKLYPFTTKQVDAIGQQIKAQSDVLVVEEYANIIKQSGLLPLTIPNTTPQADQIQESLSQFDKFLYNASLEVSSSLSSLASRKLASEVTHRAFRMFVDAYRDVFRNVEPLVADLSPPLAAPLRTVDEVEMLLSLEHEDTS
ncbi:oligomeric Golgi complex subunit 6 [Fimicolochytrium jonesii]|uniref:oligomeric Golgi complex subunit 6 n=1 Tax=Fimicolochytrium jonesii TaxID=1396493 RepID=UPI0022FDFB9C|nr:oligomeric Golgi complex subunit 6 [Fimicolochytrium jonesii]KAI8819828.1 oligomeric Golgi complex subunit 6 [Fimicolochytrium jonesii]